VKFQDSKLKERIQLGLMLPYRKKAKC